MTPKEPRLAECEAFVAGRGAEKAAELLALAEAAGLAGQVKTTSHGYIVPASILAEAEPEDETPETPETPAAEPDADPEADAAAADAQETGDEKVEQFDPTAATIAEVKDYLDGADDTERERVLSAETASAKPRKGVLDLAAAPEGAK